MAELFVRSEHNPLISVADLSYQANRVFSAGAADSCICLATADLRDILDVVPAEPA